jgi:hypothetical protein
MNSDRIKILREIQEAHELVHIMAFDTICETAGWAADEIERLRARIARLDDALRDRTAELRSRPDGSDDEQ